MQNRNKNFNIPNTLTILRILLIIPFVIYYAGDQILKAAAVLILSGLTDMFDGMIARKYHQTTELGQMLDPLSDKLTQGAVAICLAVKQPILIPFLAVFVIKEALMVSAGIFLIGKKKKRPGGSMWFGKIATVLFYISFGTIVILKGFWGIENLYVSVTLLSITAAFMIYAFIRYAQIYFDIVHSDDPKYKIDIQEVMDKKRRG
ncbi:CDP-diacylglycerol--glycerol-3-phosphate 3-phosphatidyltransferase [Clostridium sp. W14A]|uniref:CDP-diacylglycerol--glycerol-3-phosphate 3-phosphatidyltransferase n=1 Tax=Caproicibacter fermentans TaxID=2576756 RepID=A0A7G8T9X7_9FIRM|nr:CDP-alcohol phosphatidyltransferase family protein [Caproicibacter fermentans]OCN01270.1 CDP-diacylglycerol--glycerol-3-phosphate 3-phosphatidyltransferase [Clostridium sp. W14A]QNK40418.1 CDP-alcohol phosphatidyltransferase family protein [Caproicibacter fermentans]